MSQARNQLSLAACLAAAAAFLAPLLMRSLPALVILGAAVMRAVVAGGGWVACMCVGKD